LGNALSTTQIAQYRDRGYVFPVPALTPLEAAGYRETIEDFERRSGLVAGHVIRNKGHLKLTRLYDLIFHPKVLDAVESVLGPQKARTCCSRTKSPPTMSTNRRPWTSRWPKAICRFITSRFCTARRPTGPTAGALAMRYADMA
jgi:hypothetical protein